MSKLAQLALPVVSELIDYFGKDLLDNLSADSFVYSQPHAGTHWISISDGKFGTWKGHVISLYYHPEKKHTATTVGKLGTKKSEANAGHWAISVQTRAISGNKTFYSDSD
eukprot:TRINITY_DN14103_c0_g1_i1.p1 TRINITY_DN14103_c0_g1~~TRINITY_DN14103_c0_g1_i1.p1  ORF type:complete len:110 (+),score=18.16 TRINITY_DN14103_c0_g1_i1:39-368(+)